MVVVLSAPMADLDERILGILSPTNNGITIILFNLISFFNFILFFFKYPARSSWVPFCLHLQIVPRLLSCTVKNIRSVLALSALLSYKWFII